MRNTEGTALQKTNVIRRTMWITMVTAILGLLLILTYRGFYLRTERVMPGVQLRGVNLDLSGVNRTEGLGKLKTLEAKIQNNTIDIICNNTRETVSLKEIDFVINAEEIMESAFTVGQDYNFWQRQWYSLHPVTHTIALSVNIDKNKLESQLKNIITENTVLPEDARLVLNPDHTVSIIPDKPGWQADMDSLYHELVNNLSEGKDNPVNLDFIQTKAQKTAEDLRAMGIDYLLGSYTTKFKAWQGNRNHNIATAAKAMDELYIAPGEVFSFNKVVGPRSAEAGYKKAGVIVGNQLDEDLGGGVCQVSTTLYNAVLLANLGIEERYNHSLPISYASMGQDAAVAYKYLDFKFKNTTDQYIYVDTKVDGNYITVNVLGNKTFMENVKITNNIYQIIELEVIYEVDPTVPEGEEVVEKEGAKGYKVATSRLLIKNGVVVSTEKLPSSYYLKVDKVIKVRTLPEEKADGEETKEETDKEKNAETKSEKKAESSVNEEKSDSVKQNAEVDA